MISKKIMPIVLLSWVFITALLYYLSFSNFVKYLPLTKITVYENNQLVTNKNIRLNGQKCEAGICYLSETNGGWNFSISSESSADLNAKTFIVTDKNLLKEGYVQEFNVDLSTEKIDRVGEYDQNPKGTFYFNLLSIWFIVSLITLIIFQINNYLKRMSKNRKKMQLDKLFPLSIFAWFIITPILYFKVITNIDKILPSAKIAVYENNVLQSDKKIYIESGQCSFGICVVSEPNRMWRFKVVTSDSTKSYSKDIIVDNLNLNKEGYVQEFEVDLMSGLVTHTGEQDLNPKGTFYTKIFVYWLRLSAIGFVGLVVYLINQKFISKKQKK